MQSYIGLNMVFQVRSLSTYLVTHIYIQSHTYACARKDTRTCAHTCVYPSYMHNLRNSRTHVKRAQTHAHIRKKQTHIFTYIIVVLYLLTYAQTLALSIRTLYTGYFIIVYRAYYIIIILLQLMLRISINYIIINCLNWRIKQSACQLFTTVLCIEVAYILLFESSTSFKFKLINSAS